MIGLIARCIVQFAREITVRAVRVTTERTGHGYSLSTGSSVLLLVGH